jgi:hypothetical protein
MPLILVNQEEEAKKNKLQFDKDISTKSRGI